MDKKALPSEYWPGFYRTGDVQPPKNHRLGVTLLLLAVIFLGSLVSALSFWGIHLFALLQTDVDTSVRFIPNMRLSAHMPEAAANLEVSALAVEGCFLTEFDQAYFELPQGIYITRGTEDIQSLQTGDVLLRINGAAVTDPEFLRQAVAKYGEKVAVGVDLKDGFVAIKGWTETSELTAEDFFAKMEDLGVKTIICTDISRDGAMRGTNRALYKALSEKFSIDLIASGGVSSVEDITALKEMGLHGAIIGKAYYTGAIDLKEALEVAK